jgi:type IV pilus assembly protein PilO
MALSIKSMPLSQQLILYLFLGGAMYGVFHYFFYSAWQQEIENKTTQRKALQDEVEKGKGVAARLQEFKREYELREAKLQTLSRILPNNKEVDDLLRKVQGLASQLTLTVLRFKPEATKPIDFYAEWPISLELDGTYHNLAYFFDRISRLSRIVNISNLKITANPKPTITSTIKATCTATTYVFIESEPAAAPPPAGARPGAAPARPPAPAQPARR